MNNYICVTCGVQYPESIEPPEHCPICEDSRQYIGLDGQKWTTLTELQAEHKNIVEEDEPGLMGITTEPTVAIGQRARLITSPGGNVLWECISLVDDATVEAIRRLGGISAIAISADAISAMRAMLSAFGFSMLTRSFTPPSITTTVG